MRRFHGRKMVLAKLVRPSWLARPLLVCAILVGALSLVWIRTQVRDVRYRLTELEWQLKSVQEEQRELRMKRAALSSPARIEAAARRVGLRFADRSRIVIVGPQPKTIPVSEAFGSSFTRVPRS